MRIYIYSLAAGLPVGVIYSILNIRSPAPPSVALIGLLGILAGEQVIPVGRQFLAGSPLHIAWHAAKSASHVFGELPGGHSVQLAHTAAPQSPETRS